MLLITRFSTSCLLGLCVFHGSASWSGVLHYFYSSIPHLQQYSIYFCLCIYLHKPFNVSISTRYEMKCMNKHWKHLASLADLAGCRMLYGNAQHSAHPKSGRPQLSFSVLNTSRIFDLPWCHCRPPVILYSTLQGKERSWEFCMLSFAAEETRSSALMIPKEPFMMFMEYIYNPMDAYMCNVERMTTDVCSDSWVLDRGRMKPDSFLGPWLSLALFSSGRCWIYLDFDIICQLSVCFNHQS